MSNLNPASQYGPRYETVDSIVPERIREACKYRKYTYQEAAKACGMDEAEFGLMASGRKEIPRDMIFNLMLGLEFPSDFFYRVRWERT